MLRPELSVVPDSRTLAVFLDVDGTLLEIAATPDAVEVSASLLHTLNGVSACVDGALALVSGRSIRTLDALFAPQHFTAAGIHGCERRDAAGRLLRPAIDMPSFMQVRDQLAHWARAHEGTLLEDKGYALALHYRRAPQFEAAALREAESALQQLATHELQRGKFVFELRPAGYSKGHAIEAFMSEAPFRGRVPLFIGDDVTDEAGFVVTNNLGGLSIRVGEVAATAARYHLADVDDVIRWLNSLVERG